MSVGHDYYMFVFVCLAACTVADKADEYICSVLKKYTGHDDADWLMI